MKPIFWLCIICLLGGIGCLIAFGFSYRDFPKKERKRTLRHGLFMILAMWIWGLITMVSANPFDLYVIVCSLMLVTGIVHVILLYLVHKWPSQEKWVPETLFTGIIFLLGSLGFMLIFYFKPYLAPKIGIIKKLPGLGSTRLPSFISDPYRYLQNPTLLFFPIAFAMIKAWHMWLMIPKPTFSGWGYRSNSRRSRDDYDANRLSDFTFIYFEFVPCPQTHPNSAQKRAKIDPKYKIGTFFHVFLDELDRDHTFSKLCHLAVDDEGKPISWLFYRKPRHWWEWQRPLNWRLTFTQNNIKEGDTIIAKRTVGKPAPDPVFEPDQEANSGIKIRKKS